MRHVSTRGLSAVLVTILHAPAALQAHLELPAGFTATEVGPSASWDTPTGLAFAPDGRIFVTEKRGRVYVIEEGARVDTPFLNLEAEVLNRADYGLVGIALDPAFAVNGLVYLLYVVDPNGDGIDTDSYGFTRLTRYQAGDADPNTADLASRAVLLGATWATSTPALSGTHGAGSLRFGTDGTLLVSIGEGASPGPADAGGGSSSAFGPGKSLPAEDIGSFRSQWLGSLGGKILRLDPATGAGLPSNPYYTGNPFDNASRVWAYGLRNPFRFTELPGTGEADPALGRPGTLYVGDVGWNTWEEIDVLSPAGGDNFGWPCHEGPSPQPDYQAKSPAHSGCGTIGTVNNPAAARGPLLTWHHSSGSQSLPPGIDGRCTSGVAFYTGSQYPEIYRGVLFFADFTAHWIRAARLDANGALLEVLDFAADAHGPVDLEIDPASGDLFYVSILRSQIFRIRYDPTNLPPVAQAAGAPAAGTAPLAVEFSSAGSSDPNGDPLTYLWSFGDGGTSSAPNPTHVYGEAGEHTAILRVADGRGGESSATVAVTVTGGSSGNTAPVATIIEPGDLTFFHPLSDIVLKGAASDLEDPTASLRFSWEVLLHHDQHIHPAYVNLTGAEASFFANEHEAGSDNWFEIVLRVTDTGGRVGTSTVSIHPASRATIIDNGDPGTSSTGGWSLSGSPFPYGANSIYSKSSGATYTYTFQDLAPGRYHVLAWWTTLTSRTTAAPYRISHAGGETTIAADQKTGADRWHRLGTFTFGNTGAVRITSVGGNLSTAADAVSFLPAGTSDPPPVATIDLVSPNPSAPGELVSFSGHGEDNGTVTGYFWRSSLDGPLAGEPAFSSSALSAGRHTIFFHVEDDKGSSSEEDTFILDVLGAEVVLDNGQPGTSFTGTWTASGSPGAYGANSVYSKTAGHTYTYQMALPGAGVYEVHAWWTTAAGRNRAAPYRILHATGTGVVAVDQRANGGQWNYLGAYRFGPTATVTITSTGGGVSTAADAVRLVPRVDDAILDAGEPGTSAIGSWIASSGANAYGPGSLYAKGKAGTYAYSFAVAKPGNYEVLAWWTTAASRSAAAPYRIAHGGGTSTVLTNQLANGGKWNSLGTFSFTANAVVTLEAAADGKSYSADAILLRRMGP